VYAYRFSGKRYDCGSKLGYLQATVEYALGHPELGRSFRKYLLGLDVAASAAAGARRGAAGNGGAVAGDEASPRRAGARRKRPSRKGAGGAAQVPVARR
jgi:hypothetical protein